MNQQSWYYLSVSQCSGKCTFTGAAGAYVLVDLLFVSKTKKLNKNARLPIASVQMFFTEET